MISEKRLLKAMYFGNKFVRQVNLGDKTLIEAETIYPNDLSDDMQYLDISSINKTSNGGFQFLKSGILETNVVCDGYEFYGADDQPPHNTNLYTFYILNAITNEQIFRITFNTGANQSGYAQIADRYFVTTVYDANNNKIGSFTKTGAYGMLYPHYMYYDWENKRYVFGGSGYTSETGSVVVNAEYTPFKLRIVNAYNGTCPKILYFAGKHYQYHTGLRVYKSYRTQ